MDLSIYLAMTEGELRSQQALPEKPAWTDHGEQGGWVVPRQEGRVEIPTPASQARNDKGFSAIAPAWMACHFSPSTTGISGVPPGLPPGAMLILTDQTPPDGHDPQRVARELAQAVSALGCGCVLLDFQRPGDPKTEQIVRAVLDGLPCPVGVSEGYARDLSCPVLVSPPPLWTPLEAHIAPWQDREIWLEAATEDALVTLTEAGSRYELCSNTGDFPFREEGLHIAYRTEMDGRVARFYLHRGIKELGSLLHQAKGLGIQTAVGLYQQLGALRSSNR